MIHHLQGFQEGVNVTIDEVLEIIIPAIKDKSQFKLTDELKQKIEEIRK